jgi:putative transposase
VRWYFDSWAKHELERLIRDDCFEPVKLGRTPEQRWSTINTRGYPPRLSPAFSVWQKLLYEHDERKLSRKSGITYQGFEYVGPNLKPLLDRLNESTVKILVDPEDYRKIFVYVGEEEPLIPLIERYVRPETPAYSFAEMKLKKPELTVRASTDPASKQFDEDMRQAALAAIVHARPKSRRARNALATRSSRETDAVNRATSKPLTIPREDNFMNSDPVNSFSLGSVPELRVVNRTTGETE